MKLHRFFVEERILEAGEFLITNETLLNQWRNVLRMEEGSKVILFDGRGDEVLCEFVALSKKSATVKILEQKAGLVPAREVTLCMALIKKDNFELVLEKATELGVSHIIPVQADRSEKKGVNYERVQKLLREASEQSGRTTIPTIGEIVDIGSVPSEGLVVFDPRGEKSAKEFFSTYATDPVSVLVGPEGGFTDSEIDLFHSRNITVVNTGIQILRAETAAIVALALALV